MLLPACRVHADTSHWQQQEQAAQLRLDKLVQDLMTEHAAKAAAYKRERKRLSKASVLMGTGLSMLIIKQ
jgi:hypothetical protein